MSKSLLLSCPACPLLAAMVLLIAPSIAGGVNIVGSLSNFDALQSGMPIADNFELEFYGPIRATDFRNFYHGWGIPPRFDDISPLTGLQGAEVMWLDRVDAIPAGQWVHFGVSVTPDLPPMPVKAWWTKIIKLREIPVPFQWWMREGANVVDVLTQTPTYPNPVLIRRDFAMSQVPIPLEQLQYDSTPVVWSFFDVFLCYPGDIYYNLSMPYHPGISYLVRYTVTDPQVPDAPITRFVTEAIPSTMTPDFERVFVNFDLHQNIPGESFDNVELDFYGQWCDPVQVWDWYRGQSAVGIPAWGIDPLIRAFPPDPEMYDRPGFEVTWVDKFLRYNYCDRYHFGMTFDPRVMGPIPSDLTLVRGRWTRIEKTPVPVPWQFWMAGPGMNVRDIIMYGGEEAGPVMVNRQWVTLPFRIPLDELTWTNVETLPWMPVPGDPIPMMPGEIAQLDVPVGPMDLAVLVRYTADAGLNMSSRVINEALIDAGGDVPSDGDVGGDGFYLSPARPNPSSGLTRIQFTLPEAGVARLLIADVTGRQVAVLQDGWLEQGEHVRIWDGKTPEGGRAPSGVYFYALIAGQRTLTQRLVIER